MATATPGMPGTRNNKRYDPFNPDDQNYAYGGFENGLPDVPWGGMEESAPEFEDFLSGNQSTPDVPTTSTAPPSQRPWNEDEFRQGWLNSGGMNANDLNNYIQTGGWAPYLQMAGSKGDKWRLPNGQVIDMVLAQGAGGQGAQWLADPGNAPSAAFGSSVSTNTGGGQYDALMFQNIQNLLSQGNAPVSDMDPSIQSQFAPISRTLERGAMRSRGAAAERRAGQGLNMGGEGGALDSDVNSINENLGEQEGKLMSELVGSELMARRQQVQQAMQFAQGQQQMQLQAQLAAINAEIQRLGLTQQNQQFYDQFGYNVGLNEYLMSQYFNQNLGEE